MSEYKSKKGTTVITVKADFSQASDQVFVRYADCGDRAAEFGSTGKQVADFGHSPKAALAYFRQHCD